MGLKHTFCIIGIQIIQCGADYAGIIRGGSGKDIPGGRVIYKSRGVGVPEGISLLGEVFYSLGHVSASTHQIGAELFQVFIIFRSDDLIGDYILGQIRHGSAPAGISAGAVYDTAHVITGRAAIHGGAYAAFDGLGFCHGQQGIALGNILRSGGGRLEGFIEFAQVGHVDVLVVVIHGEGLLLCGSIGGFGGSSVGGGLVGFGGGLLVVVSVYHGFSAFGAGCGSENHYHGQKQCSNSLGPSFLHVCSPFFVLLERLTSRTNRGRPCSGFRPAVPCSYHSPR